jgi:fructosamine-3-kinase
MFGVKQRKHHFAHMDMQDCILEGLKKHQGFNPDATQLTPIGGGSINYAFRADYKNERTFVKANHRDRYPLMFEAEAKGLGLLAASNGFRVPEVNVVSHEGPWALIAMEFIETGSPSVSFADDFAHNLLDLHQGTASSFGLDHDNYIGSLDQSNRSHNTWSAFFASERIIPQLKMAMDSGAMEHRWMAKAERILSQLEVYFPPHPPALLHGDLWSGNYMIDASGNPVIMDPAVYYGHPLMDLGMMRLFGGFDPEIFRIYASKKGWSNDWEAGAEVANLYPLLVHVNLFGGGYVQQVQQIIQRFAG